MRRRPSSRSVLVGGGDLAGDAGDGQHPHVGVLGELLEAGVRDVRHEHAGELEVVDDVAEEGEQQLAGGAGVVGAEADADVAGRADADEHAAVPGLEHARRLVGDRVEHHLAGEAGAVDRDLQLVGELADGLLVAGPARARGGGDAGAGVHARERAGGEVAEAGQRLALAGAGDDVEVGDAVAGGGDAAVGELVDEGLAAGVVEGEPQRARAVLRGRAGGRWRCRGGCRRS
jgi:hypothetical protein